MKDIVEKLADDFMFNKRKQIEVEFLLFVHENAICKGSTVDEINKALADAGLKINVDITTREWGEEYQFSLVKILKTKKVNFLSPKINFQ